MTEAIQVPSAGVVHLDGYGNVCHDPRVSMGTCETCGGHGADPHVGDCPDRDKPHWRNWKGLRMRVSEPVPVVLAGIRTDASGGGHTVLGPFKSKPEAQAAVAEAMGLGVWGPAEHGREGMENEEWVYRVPGAGECRLTWVPR